MGHATQKGWRQDRRLMTKERGFEKLQQRMQEKGKHKKEHPLT
jgi:hypothetical protein